MAIPAIHRSPFDRLERHLRALAACRTHRRVQLARAVLSIAAASAVPERTAMRTWALRAATATPATAAATSAAASSATTGGLALIATSLAALGFLSEPALLVLSLLLAGEDELDPAFHAQKRLVLEFF